LSDSSEHHDWKTSDDWCHDSSSVLRTQRNHWNDLNSRH
jgi:hypothetical protein